MTQLMFHLRIVGMLARPQLFFTCNLCPTGGRPPKNPSYKIGPDDLLFNLAFFSTFEELQLPIHGPMEDAGVIKLYDPSSPIPCLYVAPVANVLGLPDAGSLPLLLMIMKLVTFCVC